MLGTFVEQLNKNTFVLKHADSNTLRMKVKKLIEKIDNYELEVFKPIAVLLVKLLKVTSELLHGIYKAPALLAELFTKLQS